MQVSCFEGGLGSGVEDEDDEDEEFTEIWSLGGWMEFLLVLFGRSISMWDWDRLELSEDELEEEDNDDDVEKDKEWAEVLSLQLYEFEEELGVSGYRG